MHIVPSSISTSDCHSTKVRNMWRNKQKWERNEWKEYETSSIYIYIYFIYLWLDIRLNKYVYCFYPAVSRHYITGILLKLALNTKNKNIYPALVLFEQGNCTHRIMFAICYHWSIYSVVSGTIFACCLLSFGNLGLYPAHLL